MREIESVRVHIHTYMCISTYVYNTCIYVHIYIHIHIYIYMHTHLICTHRHLGMALTMAGAHLRFFLGVLLLLFPLAGNKSLQAYIHTYISSYIHRVFCTHVVCMYVCHAMHATCLSLCGTRRGNVILHRKHLCHACMFECVRAFTFKHTYTHTHAHIHTRSCVSAPACFWRAYPSSSLSLLPLGACQPLPTCCMCEFFYVSIV